MSKPEPPKVTKKSWLNLWLFLGGGTLVLIAVIVALMQNTWQSSPVKSLFDAADYARQNPAVYNVTIGNNNSNFQVITDGVVQHLEGTLEGAKVEAVASGKDLYIKTTTPKEFLRLFLSQSNQRQAQTHENRIVFLDNLWMRANVDDLSTDSLASVLLQCGLGARVGISDANDSKQSMQSNYSANQFLDVGEVVNTDDNSVVTYRIDIDRLKSFFDGLVKTDFGKEVPRCKYVADRLDFYNEGVQYKVTMSQLDNKIESIVAVKNNVEVIKITAQYPKEKPIIQVPSEGIDLKRLIDGYNNLLANPLIEE